MKRNWIVTSVIGAALACGGVAAVNAADKARPEARERVADRPLGKLIQGRAGRAMELKAELNLTEEQTEAIKSTIQSHRQEIVKAIEPAAEKKRALRDAVLADKTDEAAIRAAADDLGKAVGDAAVTMAKVAADVRANAKLTQDQTGKVKEFISKNDAALDRFFEHVGNAK